MFKRRGRIFAGILAVMLAFSSGGISALADEPGQAEEQSAQTPEENEQTEEIKETEDIKGTEEIKEVEETEEIEETTTRTETDEEDNLQETDNVRDLVVSETENTETDSIETYIANSENLANAKVQGEAPQGTTINLFDYWITGQADKNDQSQPDNWQNHGINGGHDLKFSHGMGNWGNHDKQNAYPGSDQPPTSGIVSSALGADGYPALNTSFVKDNAGAKLSGESLAYLFDTNSGTGKVAYADVDGLLQVDSDGYYYYNWYDTSSSYDYALDRMTFCVDKNADEDTLEFPFTMYGDDNDDEYGEIY